MIKLSHNKKPNKKEAFEILFNAKFSGSNTLSNVDLDNLINYFAPPIPKVAKTVEQWVAKAVAKKEIRESLNYLYVKNNVMYGCNGSCVHWGHTAFSDGYYDPKTLSPLDYDADYPDVERLIQVDYKDCHNESLDSSKSIFKKVHCYSLNNRNYQQQFINNAVNGDDSIVFYTTNDNDKLRGSSPFGTFIIMGVR